MKKNLFALMVLVLVLVASVGNALTYMGSYGQPIPQSEGRGLNEFFITDADTTTATQEYFGYMAHTGRWYIMRMKTDSTLINFQYAGGKSDYATSWGSRETLTYTDPYGQAPITFPVY